MTIILYRSSADPRDLYKGTKLTTISTVTAEPFYPLNVSTPVFRIKYASGLENVNYCYVQELSRYYFVSSPTLESGSAIILRCDCDVLMSFRSDILNLKTICARNENEYNEFIQDEIPTSVKATTTNYILFDSTPFVVPEDEYTFCYVLNTNGLVGDN